MDGVGRDPEYTRLWGSLNVILCMWLYRRIVLRQTVTSPKMVVVGKDLFKSASCRCRPTAATSTGPPGGTWVTVNRSPAYVRIKQVFARRISEETRCKPLLPAPAWASSAGSHNRATA
jgi:hypothetical protein